MRLVDAVALAAREVASAEIADDVCPFSVAARSLRDSGVIVRQAFKQDWRVQAAVMKARVSSFPSELGREGSVE